MPYIRIDVRHLCLASIEHVDYIVHICNQRMYLLTQLKWQGLPPAQLQNVFDTIMLARVLYA